jgi:hypothetical protein
MNYHSQRLPIIFLYFLLIILKKKTRPGSKHMKLGSTRHNQVLPVQFITCSVGGSCGWVSSFRIVTDLVKENVSIDLSRRLQWVWGREWGGLRYLTYGPISVFTLCGRFLCFLVLLHLDFLYTSVTAVGSCSQPWLHFLPFLFLPCCRCLSLWTVFTRMLSHLSMLTKILLTILQAASPRLSCPQAYDWFRFGMATNSIPAIYAAQNLWIRSLIRMHRLFHMLPNQAWCSLPVTEAMSFAKESIHKVAKQEDREPPSPTPPPQG